MTPLALILHTILSLAAGAAVVGLAGVALRCEERVLIAIVLAIALPALATYIAALVLGFGAPAVLIGPVIVIAGVALAVFVGANSPWTPWRDSWKEAAVRWRERPRIGLVLFAIAVIVVLGFLFGRALVVDSTGTMVAGYQTVWADWSQHLSVESSFAVAGNVPPVNTLFSGTPLLYPFMPDFHSAELMTLGMSPELALAVPGPVLGTVIALLLVCLAERLDAPAAAGGIAAVVAFLGGGLGFLRTAGDACVASVTGIDPALVHDAGSPDAISAYDIHNAAAQGCDLHHIAATFTSWPAIIAKLPTIILHQPRSYDGLLTDYSQLAMHNLQWPAPLMGWWLPQRGFAYGCAMVLAVMVILATALREQHRDAMSWGVAGVTAGLLPLFHVHSLIALLLILPLVVIIWRRREWWVFGLTTLLVAAPRMIQLSLGPHGSEAGGNAFPQFIVGWRYHFDPTLPGLPHQGLDVQDQMTPATALTWIGHLLALPFQPDWWSFWITNLGVALPLSAVVLVASVLRFMAGPLGDRARLVLRPFPDRLLPWALGCMVVFAAGNAVAPQSWDWDNTKLFAYWYLGVGLLIGCLATHLWRRWWRAAAAAILVACTVATSVLVVVRVSAFEADKSRRGVAGPFPLESADDIKAAALVATNTPRDAVFVTSERPQDPLTALAGRTTVMGYNGWLYSYGIFTGDRSRDVETIVKGCGTKGIREPGCPVNGLLHLYAVSFVEIDGRGDGNGVHGTDTGWWAAQNLPEVAHAGEVVVYDVRQQ